MDFFDYRNGRLYAEDVSAAGIAEACGTPCYIYSRAALESNWHAFDKALGGHPHLVCYAVKANSSLAVLDLLARLGSGFDIVSEGELARVLRAGGEPAKIVFSGVGKRKDEMRAALAAGIRCFNVESAAELERLNQVAGEMEKVAPIALRVNPDVDAGTHPYIATGLKQSKFGVDINEAQEIYRRAADLPQLRVEGIACHIGSQLTSLAPMLDALDRVLVLADRLRHEDITIRHLDLGGGLGIRYRDEQPPTPAEYGRALLDRLADQQYEILLEPGRAIAGNAGILVTRVDYLKHNSDKRFAIVDAGMNDLIRPALYSAWQDIVPVEIRPDEDSKPYDVVGPVCETADFLGHDRPLAIRAGDLLAVMNAGAYGAVMGSNYNTRPRTAEVVVDGTATHLVRARERLDDLMRDERMLPSEDGSQSLS